MDANWRGMRFMESALEGGRRRKREGELLYFAHGYTHLYRTLINDFTSISLYRIRFYMAIAVRAAFLTRSREFGITRNYIARVIRIMRVQQGVINDIEKKTAVNRMPIASRRGAKGDRGRVRTSGRTGDYPWERSVSKLCTTMAWIFSFSFFFFFFSFRDIHARDLERDTPWRRGGSGPRRQ